MAVVITGIGVQSPLGCSLEECMQNIASGKQWVKDIENCDTSGFPVTHAGEIRHQGKVVRTPSHIDRKILFMDRAIEQLSNSNSFVDRYKPDERVMNVGSGVAYIDLPGYINSGAYKTRHFGTYKHYTYQETLGLAKRYEINGGCNVLVAACSASTQAMGLSYRMLRSGVHKAMITGGSESMINYLSYMGFYKLGALSPDKESPSACKPYDKNRNGTVLGEGAVAYLFENDQYADKDKIYAEIAGYGSSLDSFAPTDPDPTGETLAFAINQALKEANISPDMIDCIHTHETGTLKNAPSEYKALKLVFGKRANSLPIYSMKGQVGHLVGACGALEMLGVLYSLKHQVMMPTVNYEIPDPEIPLNVIKGEPLHMPIRYILKLNSAFGGQNAALIVKKYDK